MTALTAAIEALVGAACLGMGWVCWQRETAIFRAVGVVLAIAGAVAVANAVASGL